MFNKLAQFRRIEMANQIRQFINYLVWELDVIVHPQAQGADYVDAQGQPCFNPEEALLYDELMEQCWQVDVCCLKEAIIFESRARTLLEDLKDNEFVAGHDAAEAAQEWARTSIPLEFMECYWNAGCFDPGDTDRLYREGIKPEHCAETIDVGEGEMVPAGYAACMRLPALSSVSPDGRLSIYSSADNAIHFLASVSRLHLSSEIKRKGPDMPTSILVSIVLFCVATLYGTAQVIYAWASVPHNQPAVAFGWPLALTVVYTPLILATIVAILTLRAGRFFRLTVVSSGLASLLFPFGTVAAIFTLAVAKRQFPRWYRRSPRPIKDVT